MKTFKQFYEQNNYVIMNEELHSELQSIIDSTGETEDERMARLSRNPYDGLKTDPVAKKLSAFTKKARELLSSGQDTGLEDAKPKKGSSRAVFFPKTPKRILLDGKPAETKSVVKIAFPGYFDRYKRNDERLLGEHQNSVESDHFTANHYGMLRQEKEGEYSTNPRGVLAPVLGRHPDDHYLEMGRISKLSKPQFKRLTITDSHPEGIDFSDLQNALNKEYQDAHGKKHWYLPPSHTDEKHERIMSHPFVSNMYDMMTTIGFHPGDMNIRNMGVWTHPHTGEQHPVVSDYGYSTQVANEYRKRQHRMFGG